jgi:hypothetical protein
VGALLKMWRRPKGAGGPVSGVAVDTEVVDEFHRFRKEFGR